MSNKVGKFFENTKMKPALRKLERRYGLFAHPLRDTYAAGNWMPKSPADFLVAWNSDAQLWECKASEVYYTLRSCLADMVDRAQVGTHTLWMRAACKSRFLFYSDQTATIEFWNGRDVVASRISGKPLKVEPLASCTTEELSDTMMTMFENRGEA